MNSLRPFCLSTLFLLLSAPLAAQPDRAARVESGLVPAVRLTGEPGWNLLDRMKRYNIPGVTVAVFDGEKILWAKGYGVMDTETKEPVTERTLFVAGSISKPVAIAGALRMVRQGKLQLDANINDFLTTWKLPENELTAKRSVTLRLLASHNGGVTVHGFRGYAAGEPVPTIVQILDGVPPANSPAVRVDLEPGTRWRYAGGGTTIVQSAMIDQGGKPFPELMDELVLRPAGMTSSSYEQTLTGDRLALAASGHHADGKVIPGKRHAYPEMAAAGLWTTPTDLGKFAIAVRQASLGRSNDIMTPELAALMLTPRVSIGGTDSMCVGFFQEWHNGHAYYGHGGGDEGFICQLIANRTHGYGAAVMTNSDGPAGALIGEIMRSIAAEYGWEGYLDPPVAEVPVAEEVLRSYAGRYKTSSDFTLDVRVDGGRLRAAEMGAGEFTLVPVAGGEFVRQDRPWRYRFTAVWSGGPTTMSVISARGTVNAPRMEADLFVPLEHLVAGRIEAAIDGYRTIVRENPKDEAVNEARLNEIGYRFLRLKRVAEAIAVFKLNVELYPASSNVYDSLGEAYMTDGQKELAIKNYERSVELNPANESGKNALKKLKEQK